jgi:hypothetical protein
MLFTLTKRRLWSMPIAFAVMILGGVGMDYGQTPFVLFIAMLGALFSLPPFFFWVVDKARLRETVGVTACCAIAAYWLWTSGLTFAAFFMAVPVTGVSFMALMLGIFHLLKWLDTE